MNIEEGDFYIITKIEPKGGTLRPVHQGMLGRPTLLLFVQAGIPALLKIRSAHDRKYHAYRTSPVVRCGFENAPFIIETENAVYTLNRW